MRAPPPQQPYARFLRILPPAQGLYLSALKLYVPPKEAAADKVELTDKFVTPAAPPAPELEVPVAVAADAEDLGEEKWPPLIDPIDDPHNYSPLFEYSTEKDHGGLFPQKLKVF
ncbi:hypothetical protein HK405_013051 [Cladochytrium tenue]|nr:hypothetical protein HK405_013051 [Cladochytrium tenue]